MIKTVCSAHSLLSVRLILPVVLAANQSVTVIESCSDECC